MEPTLLEILDAREKRVQHQKELLEKYKKPLLCFTMNIPGPVKLDRDVSIGFFVCVLPVENELHKLFTGGTVGLEQGLALSRPSINIFLMILVRIRDEPK